MELVFDNKDIPDNIIKKAKENGNPIPFVNDSLLCQGDNFEIMGRLLENYKGKIDLVYIDPPFNTEQIFAVGESRVSTISRTKKGNVAYSDMMDREKYINFMYERFVLIHQLLSEAGSLYVHIDTKMGHYLKIILDEIFGEKNYRNDITRIKSNPKNFARKAYGNQKDLLLFYTKSAKNIWNDIRESCNEDELRERFNKVDAHGRRYTTVPLHAPGETNGVTGKEWRGMLPPEGRHWRTNPVEFDKLDAEGMIEWSSTGNPRIKKFASEHKGKKIQDVWEFKDPQYPIYPTEKNIKMIEMIIRQSSNPDSIVMDCFAGSGSTLLAALNHNRKFIGIDNSDMAIEVILKRLANIKDASYLKI